MNLLYTFLFFAQVSSEVFLNSPLLKAFPCADTGDVMMWYDPSLPAREKNRYYVYLNKVIPEDSLLIISFDSGAMITYNIQTERGKFLRYTFEINTNQLVMRLFKSFNGFGFTVKGVTAGEIPYIISIMINDEDICYRPNKYLFEKYLEESWNSGPQENCGRRKILRKHKLNKSSTNGRLRRSYPGEWPWHAAVYRSEESGNKYVCGATLISKSYVLTAAHCVSVRGVSLLPEMLTVVLARFELKKNSKKSHEKSVAVHRVIIYHGFTYQYLHNDIALLKLKGEVSFNAFIQPACLWYNKAIEKLPDKEILGTMVGWGYNQMSGESYKLRQAQMPIVSDVTCIMSNLDFFSDKLVDSTKFCAGYSNITTACNGDSGGAFQVFLPDDVRKTTSGAYYVRGIVSQTLASLDKPVCAPKQFIIFTDVKRYRTWIDAYVEEDDY